MSRAAVEIKLSAEETDAIDGLNLEKRERRKVQRAKIVLRCAEGKKTHEIARELWKLPFTVRKLWGRFALS